MNLSNTRQYNHFTQIRVHSMTGERDDRLYIEAGYNVFRHLEKTKTELIPFVRLKDMIRMPKCPGKLPGRVL
jgi:hypothetical protein